MRPVSERRIPAFSGSPQFIHHHVTDGGVFLDPDVTLIAIYLPIRRPIRRPAVLLLSLILLFGGGEYPRRRSISSPSCLITTLEAKPNFVMNEWMDVSF